MKKKKKEEKAAFTPEVNEEKQAQTEEKPKGGYFSKLAGIHRAMPIILFAVGVFLTLCFFDATTGIFGAAIKQFLLGLFSYGAYIVPLLFIVHSVFYASDIAKKRAVSRLIFSIATVLFIAVVAYAVMYMRMDEAPEFKPDEYYGMGKELVGGGFFGSLVAYGIIQIFGSVGLIIMTSAVFAIYIVYFFADGKSVFGRICLWLLSGLASFAPIAAPTE